MAQVRSYFLWLASLAASVGGPLPGQEMRKAADAAGAGQAVEADVRLADVVIDGEKLFSVRGFTAYPAELRAQEIVKRIVAIAANPKIDAASLTVEAGPMATVIRAEGQRIVSIIDEDAAIEQTTRGPAAELYRARIGKAIEAYRSERRPGALWVRLVYALGLTSVVLAAALLGRRLIGAMRIRIERRYRLHVEGLENRAMHMVKVEQVWRVVAAILKLAFGLGMTFMVYAYLHYVLSLFPWTRGFAKGLWTVAIDPLRTMGLGLVSIIPNLVFLAILVFITRYALKVMRILVEGVASGAVVFTGFDPEWAWPTYRLVRLLVIVLTVVVAYPYFPGSESGAFKGVSLFMGVVFSLGSSSLIGNFIAGYTLTYRRAFRVGDRVKIGEQIGNVERVRLLVTHLRTPKNEEVIVPNSTILNGEVVNYSSMAKRRGLILHTTVGIGYETPWRQVEAMLLEAAMRTEGLRKDPAPYVLQTLLGDFCVTYEINVSCDTPETMEAHYTALHRNILDVFNEYGVQIMTPAYETDPEQPKIVTKDQWYAAPAGSSQAAVTVR